MGVRVNCLESFRQERNLTYKEVGAMLDFPPSKVYRLSKNLSSIKLADAVKIEIALGISVESICSYL